MPEPNKPEQPNPSTPNTPRTPSPQGFPPDADRGTEPREPEHPGGDRRPDRNDR